MSGSRTGRNGTLPEGRRWELGMGEPGPFTGLAHTEDYKVPGLDGRDVRIRVGGGESASSQIVKAET